MYALMQVFYTSHEESSGRDDYCILNMSENPTGQDHLSSLAACRMVLRRS